MNFVLIYRQRYRPPCVQRPGRCRPDPLDPWRWTGRCLLDLTFCFFHHPRACNSALDASWCCLVLMWARHWAPLRLTAPSPSPPSHRACALLGPSPSPCAPLVLSHSLALPRYHSLGNSAPTIVALPMLQARHTPVCPLEAGGVRLALSSSIMSLTPSHNLPSLSLLHLRHRLRCPERLRFLSPRTPCPESRSATVTPSVGTLAPLLPERYTSVVLASASLVQWQRNHGHRDAGQACDLRLRRSHLPGQAHSGQESRRGESLTRRTYKRPARFPRPRSRHRPGPL